MMKTEFPTNGELPISKEREHRRGVAIQDHHDNRSEHVDAEDSSGKEKKQSLFRRPGVIIAAAALAIVGIGYGTFAMFHSFTHESTDDAFVDAHIILTAPKIAGRVAAVHIDDNQDVKKGDLLVEIDPADAEAALAQAKAKLGHDEAAQLKADQDLKRQQDLFGKGAISPQDRDTAIQNAATTKADVQTDKAAIQQAELNLSYTKIFAPDGWSGDEESGRARRLRASRTNYICARHARALDDGEFQGNAIAQHASGSAGCKSVSMLTRTIRCADMSIVFRPAAVRDSVLLPPENATGNYVKVVQRVPVKIVLDEQPDVQRALGPGMSVVPTVTVSDGAGVLLTVVSIGIALAIGVIVGAALWIGRVRKG